MARKDDQELFPVTLRDYFAAKALPLAWQAEREMPIGNHGEFTYRGVTIRAYLIADAMLVEREK